MRGSRVILIVLVLSLALAGAAEAQKKGGEGGGDKSRGSSSGGSSNGKRDGAPGHDPSGPGNSENAPGHDPDGPGNSENAGNATAGTNETDEPLDPASDEPHGKPETPGGTPADKRDAGQEKGARPEEARGKSANAPGRNESRVPPGQEKAHGKSDDARGKANDAAGRSTRETDDANGRSPGRGNDDKLALASTPKAPPPKAVHVREGDREVDVARSNVRVAGEGVSDTTQALLVIVHPNGTEELLAAGTTEAQWNTTSYENGYYTVEVRERTSSGETMTVASTRVLVENPRVEAIAAVGAVATGAAVSAGAGMLAARGFDVLSILKQAAVDAGSEAAEEKLRMKTAAVAALDWRRRSLILLVAAGAMLAFFKVFAARDQMLLALPIAFLAAFVCTVGDYAAEWALSRASGAQTRFRLWIPGALSLAISSVLFRAPFGYPGYVSETDVGEAGDAARLRRRAGLRAIAFMGAGVALTLPFLAVGAAWRWELAEYGVGVALMIAAAGAMPFSPMPGRDVWAWSRLAWLALFVTFLALYVGWQTALLPLGALVSLGMVGVVGFFFALEWLARTARASG